MLRTASRLSLLIVSICLLTGPLAILQIGAWGWMLASYSQESSFEQAVQETFGGERPCGMCKLITEVEETEQEQTPANTPGSEKDLKLMLGLAQRVQATQPTAQQWIQYTQVDSPESLSVGVPTPPPRLV